MIAGVRLVDEPTIVLVHGAGHTANVWRSTRRALTTPSVAVNLPGRDGRSGDVAQLTVTSASCSVTEEILTATSSEQLLLVGHSVSGVLLPSITAALDGRVRHLVFVAGISAREAELPADVYAPGRSEQFAQHLAYLRSEHAGAHLEDLGKHDARAIDSLSLSCEPMRWQGLAPSTPRTFVRCLEDRIQSREVQDRLVDRCGADDVFDIHSGHTPAIDAPEALAQILDQIALRQWGDRPRADAPTPLEELELGAAGG